MSGLDNNDKGGESPGYWSPTDDPGPAPLGRYNAPRSLTPKGTLFTNLGDAHQAITSRSTSRSAGEDVSDTSPKPSSAPSGSTSFVNVSGSSGSADDEDDETGSVVHHTPPFMNDIGGNNRGNHSPSGRRLGERSVTPFAFMGAPANPANPAIRGNWGHPSSWPSSPVDPSPNVSGFGSSSLDNSVNSANSLNSTNSAGNAVATAESRNSSSLEPLQEEDHSVVDENESTAHLVYAPTPNHLPAAGTFPTVEHNVYEDRSELRRANTAGDNPFDQQQHADGQQMGTVVRERLSQAPYVEEVVNPQHGRFPQEPLSAPASIPSASSNSDASSNEIQNSGLPVRSQHAFSADVKHTGTIDPGDICRINPLYVAPPTSRRFHTLPAAPSAGESGSADFDGHDVDKNGKVDKVKGVDRGFDEDKSMLRQRESQRESEHDQSNTSSFFVEPSREREVSMALRVASTGSTFSTGDGGIYHTSSPAGYGSPYGGAGPSTSYKSPTTGTKRNRDFDDEAIENYWDDASRPNDPNMVRIAVRPAPGARPGIVSNESPGNNGNNDNDTPGTVRGHRGLSALVPGLGGSRRRRREVNTLLSDGADWETVATSIGQFESNRAFASSMELDPSSGHIKMTGSSIADYSDTESIHVPDFEGFSASTEQILLQPVQPPRSCFQPSLRDYDTRYPRTLNDTHHPVFTPTPRIHRTNGYLQRQSRLFMSHLPGSGSDHNSVRSGGGKSAAGNVTGSGTGGNGNSLVDRLSKSIRSGRGSSHKRVKLSSKDSRFQSLESLSSTYSDPPDGFTEIPLTGAFHDGMRALSRPLNNTAGITIIDRNNNNGQSSEPGPSSGSRSGSGLLPSALPRAPPLAHLTRLDRDSANSSRSVAVALGSPTMFSFPLIGLKEAAEREREKSNQARLADENAERKAKAASNANALGHPVKNQSIVSSNIRMIPATPPATRPASTRPSSYRPSSVSIFGIANSPRGRAEFMLDDIMGHNRGTSNVTSFKSGTPLVDTSADISAAADTTATTAGKKSKGSSSTNRFSRAFRTSIFSGLRAGPRAVFASPPRLVPRDERRLARARLAQAEAAGHHNRPTPAPSTANGHNTSSLIAMSYLSPAELRQLALDSAAANGSVGLGPNGAIFDPAGMPYGFVPEHPQQFTTAALEDSEDAYLSWDSRRRRQMWYIFMCALCIFPFMAPLIARGTFDPALGWLTHGEVGSLTRRQRRNVIMCAIVWGGVWLVVVAVAVTVLATTTRK
ncbi:uncharacterized protein C8A04DRAFT_24410 [Dichotomopilus funicola]|uniref:Uncharacterized protein n=1 Tax=Dichotomopilus funicola TaxID=1934379 RepID=A0AAN6VAK0_9PEZI|nr:hypothetical protein C8A04DRAFT_24410 [Dichotomopilus funicola]